MENKIPLELAGYVGCYVLLREFAEYKYGTVAPYRANIADFSALAVVVFGILPGLVMVANQRWFWATPDIRHESHLVITHIAVAIHNHFILPQRQISIPLLAFGTAAVALECVAMDGVLHRILLMVCVVTDATLLLARASSRFPEFAVHLYRLMLAGRLIGSIAIVFFEIWNAASIKETWHLFPALVAINHLFPVEEIFEPWTNFGPIESFDRRVKHIANVLETAVSPAKPSLMIESVEPIEVVETHPDMPPEPTPSRSKNRRKTRG